MEPLRWSEGDSTSLDCVYGPFPIDDRVCMCIYTFHHWLPAVQLMPSRPFLLCYLLNGFNSVALSIVSTRYCTSPSLRHDDVRWASWEKGKKNKKKQLARLLRYIGHWDQVKIKMNIKKDYYTHRNGREWGPFFCGIYLFFFDAMGVYTVTVFHPQNA